MKKYSVLILLSIVFIGGCIPTYVLKENADYAEVRIVSTNLDNIRWIAFDTHGKQCQENRILGSFEQNKMPSSSQVIDIPGNDNYKREHYLNTKIEAGNDFIFSTKVNGLTGGLCVDTFEFIPESGGKYEIKIDTNLPNGMKTCSVRINKLTKSTDGIKYTPVLTKDPGVRCEHGSDKQFEKIGRTELGRDIAAVLYSPPNVAINSVDGSTDGLYTGICNGPFCIIGTELYMDPGTHVLEIKYSGAVDYYSIKVRYTFESGKSYRLIANVVSGAIEYSISEW